MNTEDIAALAQQLRNLQLPASSAADVGHVSVKIPPFWTTRPEVWFTLIEAQFATRNITAEDTKYNHAVTALDQSVAEEISAFCAHLQQLTSTLH